MKPYKYRNPVMVLGDGLIGQMMEPVSFKENKEIAMENKNTLFPFPEEHVAAAADQACCKAVLSVEMNMGQMVEDVKRSVGRHKPVRWYGKCGGEMPTPEEVAGEVEKLIADTDIA